MYKYYIAVFSLIALLIGIIIYQQTKFNKQQAIIDNQIIIQKQLVDQITRAESKYVSSQELLDNLKKINVNYEAIKKDLDSLHAEVKSVTTISVVSNGTQQTNVPSDHAEPMVSNNSNNPIKTDINGYYSSIQYKDLVEDFEKTKVPIGTIGFSAKEKNPWQVSLLPREYTTSIVMGLDENQRMYSYSAFSINVGEKNYKLNIKKAETIQEFPASKWTFWRPTLSLGLDAGISTTQVVDAAASLNFNFIQYGMYTKSPDWTFAQLGCSYTFVDKRLNLIITPVTYNIGKIIPIISNTHVSASAHISPITPNTVSIMLGLRLLL